MIREYWYTSATPERRHAPSRSVKYARAFALLLGSMVTLSACSSSDDDGGSGNVADEDSDTPIVDMDADPENPEPTLAGFLYTTTNGESTNQVVKLDRMSDGSLQNEVAYTTNSEGGADTSVGGAARGDFDSQNAIQLIDDYLLNVNAGGDTISVFFVDRPTGDLTLIGNVDSAGERPVSIDFTPKDGSVDQYWVVVGNQWNNPNVQGDGDGLQRFPDDAFHQQDLTQSDPTDQVRNIALFSFDANTGALSFESVIDTYVRENGGPTALTISDDGTKIAVATWGIAHFGTEMTSLDEQHASRVYVYDFDNGVVSGERFFEEDGIAGSIGINWASGSSSTLHVSNFNLIPGKRDNSLTVLSDDGSAVAKDANFNTAEIGDIDEACWTLLNPDGDVLYVASFGANTITAFDVDETGSIVSEGTVTAREGFAPAGDSKDMYITSDNAYLYNAGAFQSFSIVRFDIADEGLTYVSQTDLATTSASIGSVGTFNFLGLIGYDL